MSAALWIVTAWLAIGTLLTLAKPRKQLDWASGVGFTLATITNIFTVLVVAYAAMRGVR